MANAHRTNVLVTSCLKTPVDPHTKSQVALYEREKAFPYTPAHTDHLDYKEEMPYEDSDSEYSDEGTSGNRSPVTHKDYRVMEERINLHDIFFSNEEYYSKLEELKQAHLRTMAELENMYRQKLQLKSLPPAETTVEAGHRVPWTRNIPPAFGRLWKSHSAVELRTGSRPSSHEDVAACNDVGNGQLFSPKDHIRNMWQDFRLSPRNRRPSSFQSLPDDKRLQHPKGKAKKKQRQRDAEQESWKHRRTIPKPFKMTLREDERRQHGVKTRAAVERENAELRRQLEELTECRRTFRASPAPAHTRLPLYEELREREEEERRRRRSEEEHHLRATQKPFSFLERERLKRQRRQEQLLLLLSAPQERARPFKARPVPKAVYEAAAGEHSKEQQLYRTIKMQMRAREMLYSASMPPSMLARRLNQQQNTKDLTEGAKGFPHRPQINRQVPDFDASFRRFQKHLESRKEVKPVTACEPFQFRTSQIPSHRERALADVEKEQASPRARRRPYISPRPVGTPASSPCSSLSGSLELLPAKVTDASIKRQEAVRKTLEQRKKAEEDEERWRERQKLREKELQQVVLRRAEANDPHVALAQSFQSKLKEFRKQDLQRRREYQQEIREIQQRVKGRPLLLEQVAQTNARRAAEKRYADALRGCGLTEDFIRGKVPKSQLPGTSGAASKASCSSDCKKRDVYLNSDDEDDTEEEGEDPVSCPQGEDRSQYWSDEGGGEEQHYSDDSYHYSEDHDDHDDYSDTEHPAQGEAQQDTGHSKHSQSSDGENGAGLHDACDEEQGHV